VFSEKTKQQGVSTRLNYFKCLAG